MTTFSQLVDRVAKEIVRPDMLEKLPGYLNQTIREIFEHAETARPVFFDDARNEERVVIDTLSDLSSSFVWPLPRAARFQMLESAYYEAHRVYAQKGNPKNSLATNDFSVNSKYFWYRVGASLVFAQPGNIGNGIRLSWFEFPRALAYQNASARLVVYDQTTDTYAIQPGAPADAMELSTNWLLERHAETLAEGMRAKAYKRMNDDRQRTHYSQYQSSRLAVQQTAIEYEVVTAR